MNKNKKTFEMLKKRKFKRNENNLSKNISNSLKNLNSGEYSDLIKVNNNYLILYVNEKKISKKK